MSLIIVGPSGAVLWASDADTSSPYNYTSLHTTPSNGGYGEGSYTLAPVYDSDYGGNLLALTHSGSGQIQLGAILGGTPISNVFTALGSGDMYMRWLLKFPGSAWWGAWTEEAELGYEWKWIDFGDNGTSRIIVKFKTASYDTPTDNFGAIHVRVDGDGPNVEWQNWVTETSDSFTYDTLYYLEIGILANGQLKVWIAPYTGVGNEYVEGTTYRTEAASWHSWNPSLVSSGERPIDAFINHEDDVDKVVRYQFAINGSFIGPGPVTSTY